MGSIEILAAGVSAHHLSYEGFDERCFIAFEGDDEPVYRMWDPHENVGR